MKSTISSLRIDIPHTTKEERRIDQIAGAITMYTRNGLSEIASTNTKRKCNLFIYLIKSKN